MAAEGSRPNFANRTVWTADCLYVLRGMNSDSVDLIYLDPPFNSKADYSAPIGSTAAGAGFKDTWSLSDVDAEWINLMEARHPALHRVLLAAMVDSDKSYLAYMAARLLEMRRVLKPAGSIYLHCDPTMSHYLKLVMDAVFGRENFRNEIAWCYRKWAVAAGQFVRNHDILLFYSRDPSGARPFNVQYLSPSAGTLKRWKGKRQQAVFEHGIRKATSTDEEAGVPCPDWWEISVINPNAKERTGYPTQKPLALLERVIRASSNNGDMVLDPFCGCATTCVAAESLGREWAGIDLSPKAVELVKHRLSDEHGAFGQIAARTAPPRRTDLGKLPAPRTHRNTLYGLQGGFCTGCGEHFQLRHLEVDHIIARAKGGTDHAENLQLLCGHCNRTKGDRGMAYLRAKLQLHG